MRNSKTIHLKEPNTLSDYLGEKERQSIVSLKIVGLVGHKDFDVLDDMCTAWGEYDENDNFIIDYEETPALRHLDMGEATLVDCEGLPDIGYHPPLETLVLPQGVQIIGFEAFSEAENLHTVELPKGLRSVGGFMSCPKLTNLILPEGLEEIQSCAFAGCSAITTIRIPASVRALDGSCFEGCNIKAYEVDKDNPYFTAIDGVVYSKDLSTLVAFPSAYPDKHFVIPDSTHTIGASAFSDSRIENIDIPKGLSVIGDLAFGSSTIHCIDIPDSVTKVGKGAFSHCFQLEQVRLSNQLEEIPSRLFCSCPKLKILDVPSSVRRIYYSAIAWSGGLEKIILHDGLEEIVDEGPLLGCGGNLQEVTLPKTLKKVPGGVFNYTSYIKSYQLNPENPYFSIMDGALYSKDRRVLYAIPDSERTSFIVPEGVEIIGERAFAFLPKLKKIILPSTLHTIGTRAFQEVYALLQITIPENVTQIDVNAFLCCDKLQTITMKNSTPPMMTGIVKDDEWKFHNIKLRVPHDSITTYKETPGWKSFNVIGIESVP